MGLSAPAPLGRRRRRGGAFRVPQLFANGEAGAWYDPSDLTAEKVAWRRNLLTWSEDFTNAAWTKTNSSITSNAGTSWDGTATASKLVNNTANTVHHLRHDTPYPTVRPSVPYAMSIYAKAAELSWIYLLSLGRSPSDGASESSAWFNLANGTVGFQANCTASIESVGNGWYRCSILTTTAGLSASSQREMRIGLATGDTVQSYLGDGTSGVLIDSAQMEPFSLTAYQRITDFTSDFLAAFPNHTLYQDSAGTTPVTALGQPVGLVIDSKTGGLGNLGPELVTNGDFSSGATGWSVGSGWTISGGVASNDGSGTGQLRDNNVQYVAGRSYLVQFDATVSVSQVNVTLETTFIAGVAASGRYRYIVTVASNSFSRLFFQPNGGFVGTVDNISVREVPGVHAIQPTSASRPLLDGRVNLLERTEEFDNAYWTKENVTITANAGVAPDGTTTADLVYPTTSGSSNRWVRRSTTVSGTAAYQMRVAVKASGLTWAYVLDVPGLAGAAWINAQTGAVGTVASGYTATSRSLGNGWYELVVLSPAITGSSMFMPYIGVSDSNNSLAVTASGTNGVLIHGADLRLAADAAYPYQRVAAATDYADVGVPRSFLFDGFDDSLYTAANLDLSGTDKVTVLAGVRKLSDAAVGVLAETSAVATSTNGCWLITAPDGAGFRYGAGMRGTNVVIITTSAAALTAPVTNVLTLIGNIAAPQTTLRANGAVAATDAGSLGTGNFGSQVLYIGRRNNASFPFNGKAYQLIVRGALTDAATLVQAERFVAQRTGITL